MGRLALPMIGREECLRCLHSVRGAKRLEGTTALVTGGSGLIGSYLARVLVASNVQVWLLGRDRMVRLLDGRGEAFELGDRGLRPDWVIHCASPTVPGRYLANPQDLLDANVSLTYELLDLIASRRMGRILYVSSAEAFGIPAPGQVFRDASRGSVEVPSARSAYPHAKRLAEALCLGAVERGISAVIARPSFVFGSTAKADDTRVVAHILRSVIGDGQVVLRSAGVQRRSFTYVGDCVSGLLQILLDGESGSLHGVADPDGAMTLRQFAQTVTECARELGLHASLEVLGEPEAAPPADQVVYPDGLLGMGWTAPFGVREGVLTTLRHLGHSSTKP